MEAASALSGADGPLRVRSDAVSQGDSQRPSRRTSMPPPPDSPRRVEDSERESNFVIIRTLASHCIVPGIQGEVWSCSNVSGLLHVWDSSTFSQAKCGGEWMIDCDGLNVLLPTEAAIWGGANNGSCYVWDLETHSLLREITSHSDGVRSLCAMQSFVVSGSGSRDGTLVVWKKRLQTLNNKK
jgi:WD40 repeat protein